MKTQFKGRSLIEAPKDVPQIGYIDGDFGREFLNEYNGIVEAEYDNNPNLRVLNESNGLIVGSNPPAVVVANKVLREEGLRTATQADLEKALRLDVLNLRGTYEDTGLVLRSEGEPNSYLAKNLSEQLKARNPKIKYPVLVNLTDLELRMDQDSNYGLAFRLKEDAAPIYAPILNQPGRFNSADINKSTGLPEKVGSGDRYLFIGNSGLSRLFLGRGLDLYSSNGGVGLAGSDSGGRVVVVSDAATKNF